MLNRVFNNNIPDNFVVISMVSENDQDSRFPLNQSPTVLNVAVDDCDPATFNPNGEEIYDFTYYSGILGKSINIHCLSEQQANTIVKQIEKWNNDDKIDTILVHCSAGASRSQGVVKYVVDTYSTKDFKIMTRKSNPCLTPNIHISTMLKKSYRELYMNVENFT